MLELLNRVVIIAEKSLICGVDICMGMVNRSSSFRFTCTVLHPQLLVFWGISTLCLGNVQLPVLHEPEALLSVVLWQVCAIKTDVVTVFLHAQSCLKMLTPVVTTNTVAANVNVSIL